MDIFEDFYDIGEGSDDSYNPEVQEESGQVLPPTDVSALRRVPASQADELKEAIIRVSEQLGIDPVHLATAISYETGGTFDPWKRGPTTQWGTHRGLIQWGEPQARRYGVSADTSVSDQLDAIGRYLKDAGVRSGMGLLDIYSAINAGRVGLYDRSDANNGGAPGTVRDKVEKQMGGHAQKAAALLGNTLAAYQDESTPRDDLPPIVSKGTNYVRPANFIPGDQGRFVPPEKRGPFARYGSGVATVGNPTVDPTVLHYKNVPADSDLPGLPLDDATPIPAQLAALLKPTEPVLPILDESAGLNLAKTAPNISISSVDPVIDESAGLNLSLPPPAPILPPKDQESLLVTKGKLDANSPRPPISQSNLDTSQFSYLDQVSPPVPPKAPSSFMDMVDAAVGVGKDTYQGAKQFGAKVLGTITGQPFDLAAAARAAIPSFSGINRMESAGNLLNEGQKMRQAADFAFGVDKPETPFQKAAALVGKNVTPMGANTLTATGLMTAADLASQGIISAAQAKPTMTKQEAEQILFPGPGNNNQSGPRVPRVTHTVMTAAGPAKLDDANFRLLGYMGAITIGALVAPSMAKKMISTVMPGRIGRDVVHAPAGTEAFSNRMDLFHTAHDKYAGTMRIARDLGVNTTALKEMQQVFDFQTGSASRNLTNAAVLTGQMETPNFSFKVNTPMLKLAGVEDDAVTQYMELYHRLDQVREQQRVLMTKNQQTILNAGVPQVRGTTQYQIGQAIRQMEAGPQGQMLKDFRTAYLDNQTAVRKFEATGEYATMSADAYRTAQKRQRNNIWQDLDLGNTNQTPGKVTESFADSMTQRMRSRMENEAKGLYIDNMVTQNPNFATKVTAEELAKNKSWNKNVVEFYRRGQKEYWVTDPFIADVLKMDPYMMGGVMGAVINGSRDFVQKTTTGVLAPWFSTTNMLRNHQLIKLSETAGFKTPNMLNTAAAIPQQLYAQMAKGFSDRLEHWSQGWLGQTLGPQNLQGLSTKLAQVYDQSTYAALTTRGGVHTGMFLDYNREAAQSIASALSQVPHGVTHTALSGLKQMFEAVHNAPVFAYASKNIKAGKNIDQVTMAARDIVGNPHKIGQFATKSGPIRFVDETQTAAGRIATDYVKAWGATHELGRQFVPWWNVTTQGMKRVGKAYWDNPGKFVSRAYLYQIMPAAAVYMYNRGLGTDPNGISYNDYQMNRRSGYNSLMNMYIAIPGKPAEEGIQIPLPHELAVMQSMMNAALHHMTNSEVFNRHDDFMRTALSLVGKDYKPSMDVPVRTAEEDFMKVMKRGAEVGLIPATPPMIGAALGSMGIVTPNGPFGGAYTKKEDPYDAFQGMNTGFEMAIRAIAPGLADVVGAGLYAYTHSEDKVDGIGAGIKASTRRAVEKTPIVRDAIGWKAPVAGSTDITEEMFADKGVLSKLDQYFRSKDVTAPKKEKRYGASREGAMVADLFMPAQPPNETLGLPQPAPVNALYSAFMQELDKKLMADTISERGKGATPTGGIGFKSHMKRYSEFTDQIKAMRNIDEGNMVTWKKRIEGNQELEMYLRINNIPIDNPRMVRNFLEHERQTAARQIMFTLKALEQDFQRRLGDPKFQFKDLDPNKPYMLPQGVQVPAFKPQFPSYWDQKTGTPRL